VSASAAPAPCSPKGPAGRPAPVRTETRDEVPATGRSPPRCRLGGYSGAGGGDAPRGALRRRAGVPERVCGCFETNFIADRVHVRPFCDGRRRLRHCETRDGEEVPPCDLLQALQSQAEPARGRHCCRRCALRLLVSYPFLGHAAQRAPGSPGAPADEPQSFDPLVIPISPRRRHLRRTPPASLYLRIPPPPPPPRPPVSPPTPPPPPTPLPHPNAGFVAGSGDDIDWAGMGWTSLGTFMCSASANTLNQIIEIKVTLPAGIRRGSASRALSLGPRNPSP